MPWVRLDDRFPSHRKVALLSDRAFRLYISGLCWSSENLTEGRILDRELPLVSRIRGVKTAAKELEDARLWDRVEGGWCIHDFLEYNPDRARVQADRAANAARQKAFRDRKKAEREAKKAAADTSRNGVRNGVTQSGETHDGDTKTARRRHDGDTTAQRSNPVHEENSQVTAFRNGVSNGTPAPAPSPTASPYGDAAASERHHDRLGELKQAIAAAGLTGVAWDLRESAWEYTRQAVDRVGIPAMVAYAASSARLKGQPASATAWVQGWRSLEAAPEGITPLPSLGAAVVPFRDRQQQATDDMFDRAMARAKARMQQETS